jgi:hypothetical protein
MDGGTNTSAIGWRPSMDAHIEVIHADSLAWIVGKDPRDWAVLVFDPPYGIDYHVGTCPRVRFHAPIANDKTTRVSDTIMEWWGDGAAAVFGTWKVPHYGRPRGRLIWDKNDIGGMGDLSFPFGCTDEEIAVYGQGWHGHRGGSVLRHSSITGNKYHPHEKPVALLMEILAKAPAGAVLDLQVCNHGRASHTLLRPSRSQRLEIDGQWIPVARDRTSATPILPRRGTLALDFGVPS